MKGSWPAQWFTYICMKHMANNTAETKLRKFIRGKSKSRKGIKLLNKVFNNPVHPVLLPLPYPEPRPTQIFWIWNILYSYFEPVCRSLRSIKHFTYYMFSFFRVSPSPAKNIIKKHFNDGSSAHTQCTSQCNWHAEVKSKYAENSTLLPYQVLSV